MRGRVVWWVVWALAAGLLLPGAGARAQGGPGGAGAATGGVSADTGAYAQVLVEGRKLFDILGSSGLSAAERADRVNRRLSSLISQNNSVRPFTKTDIKTVGNQSLITLGGQPILYVTDADAQDALATRDELALLWGAKMATAVADARAARRNPLEGAGILIKNSFSDLAVSALKWLPRLAGALVLFFLFWLLATFARWVVSLAVSHTHFDVNFRQLLRAIAYYGTWIVGVVAILSTLGLQSSGIATTLGVSGFILGFAFKDILSHFFAGLMLLLGRQFHIGDQIIVKDQEGTVERIELRALYLRTYDNRIVIIPNGDVFTSIVTSNTASPLRRREVVVTIDYGNDVRRAQAVALEAVRKVDGVADTPPPDVLVDELSDAGVSLRARFYANSQRSDYLKVGSDCMARIKEAFDRDKIAMPISSEVVTIDNLPQLTGALRTDDGHAPASGGAAPKQAA